MAAFGIGEETTNGADGLLVYGADDSKLSESFDRLVRADAIYGATASNSAAQTRYLEGDEEARLEDGAADFLTRLESQRCRIAIDHPGTRWIEKRPRAWI